MEAFGRLIIVDDEAIIREGLRDMVDWPSLGFEVAGCFEDGREAIDFLADHPVDVVLTDIMMDEVTGIDIARHIHEHDPGIRIVLLSGYRDFAFAQQAIEFHVFRYLLKPVDFDELAGLFTEIRADILASGKDRSEYVHTAARRQLFADIVSRRIDSPDDLARGIGQLQLDVDVSTCPCELIMLKVARSDGSLPTGSTVSSIIDFLAAKCDIGYLEPVISLGERTVLLAVSRNSCGCSEFHERISAAIDRCSSEIGSAFRVSLLAEWLETYRGLSDFMNSDPARIIQAVFRNVEPVAADAPGDRGKVALEKVIEYLESDFRRGISLSDAASKAGLNPVYFSKFFKDHTGLTFTSYLSRLRIERAISLMQDRKYRISDIGELVGYPNHRYFARVFRKITGYSPRDYRARIGSRIL
jgi:two-component system, response regulator YesN